jgi:spore maturation protein CgeB
MLDRLEGELGARRALPLYCAVDADRYLPTRHPKTTALGYLGPWSADRQPKVQELLLDVARKEPDRFFAIGGPGYPDADTWPRNVLWRPNVPPQDHLAFYGQQRFTLNLTRPDRQRAGWSPSVRMFEAAACGTPILTDAWDGLEAFFRPGHEVLVVESTEDVLRVLRDTKEERRLELGAAARRRVFAEHTAVHRAQELTQYLVAAGQWGPASVDRPAFADRL